MANIKPVQAKATSLYGSGAVLGATSITLTDLVDVYGNTLATADFGTKIFGTLEPGTDNEEPITATGVTANADGTYTLTGVKSVLAKSPFTETSGLLRQHSGGVRFVISNTAAFYDELLIAGGDETITGVYTFDADAPPRMDGTVTYGAGSEKYLVTKEQLDSVVAAGAPDASTTAKGLVEEATAAQMAAGTAAGETAARLFSNPATLAAQIQSGTWLYGVEDGTGADDTYTVALTPALTAYTAGQSFRIKFTVANTGAATVNLDGLGAKAIKKFTNAGAYVDLETNDIRANQTVELYYDGTNMVLETPARQLSSATTAEVQTFFDSTDITAAEAETLTNGSLASPLHYHDPYEESRGQLASNIRTLVGGLGDGMTSLINDTGVVARGVSNTYCQVGVLDDAMIYASTINSVITPTATRVQLLFAVDDVQGSFAGSDSTHFAFGLFTTNSVIEDATSVTSHVGFLLDTTTSNVVRLFASNANGATQTKSASLTWTATNRNVFEIDWQIGTNIRYYLNGTLVATHTTNMPSYVPGGATVLLFGTHADVGRSGNFTLLHPFVLKVT